MLVEVQKSSNWWRSREAGLAAKTGVFNMWQLRYSYSYLHLTGPSLLSFHPGFSATSASAWMPHIVLQSFSQ